MKTLPFRSQLASCLCLLLATLMLSACNSEGGDEDTDSTGSGTNRQQAAALVPLPTRGAINETGRFMDLAINGEGMFVLADSGNTEPVYSRYGRFDIDASGALIDSEGRRLMGQVARGSSTETAPVAAPLPLIPRQLPPKASSRIEIDFNLDARERAPFDLFDPTDDTTYNSATSATVYDAMGQTFALTIYFRKANAYDTWDAFITVDGLPLPADGSPAIPNMQFDYQGLVSSRTASITIPARTGSNPSGAALPVNLLLDISRTTQFAAAFSVTRLSQDGYAPGHIARIDFSERGFITAFYTNEQSRPAGQVLLAKFTVADRFGLVGEHGYSCKRSCAQPVIQVPGVLLLGTLLAGSLEPR